MEDNKDILLNQLFAEAAKTEIADNGFTRKVMRQLPSRAELYNHIWTCACIIVAVILLTYFKAWNYLFDLAVNAICVTHNIDWLYLMPVVILLPTLTMIISSVFAYHELKA